jgi:hypothetical protein
LSGPEYPRRDPRVSPNLIETLGGVAFDIRGVIQLTGLALERFDRSYPKSVEGIKIGRSCRRIHFLQSTGGEEQDGVQVGSYIVHYASGHQEEIAIVYGMDVADWEFDQKDLGRASTAWRGTRRLLKSTWENPLPESEITTIDYVSKLTTAAPFLIAITVD